MPKKVRDAHRTAVGIGRLLFPDPVEREKVADVARDLSAWTQVLGTLGIDTAEGALREEWDAEEQENAQDADGA